MASETVALLPIVPVLATARPSSGLVQQGAVYVAAAPGEALSPNEQFRQAAVSQNCHVRVKICHAG
jgi:hypothetical protein